ncbi:hypothetical protein C7B82_16320 [Stenomitos frigidus ULC18]|uniref:Uncharacterized protein n=1 Tax=Stenomitos frigidus ULC18 TaxID=2107698 RepID=A0A2T1E498_9CYAN|nr:hypothetical protein C7B82_16320 [Stenomitos frigidus ULC18]
MNQQSSNLLAHFACLVSLFGVFRKQSDKLRSHFNHLLSHFSRSRIHFGVFRKQKGKLRSQTVVCVLISVDRAFTTAIALLL